MRALSAHRESSAMPHAAVAVDLHQPLDVEADVFTQIALDFVSVGDDLTDLTNVVLLQILHPDVFVDARFAEDRVGGRAADAEDVR
jgi:hypothetical protein